MTSLVATTQNKLFEAMLESLGPQGASGDVHPTASDNEGTALVDYESIALPDEAGHEHQTQRSTEIDGGQREGLLHRAGRPSAGIYSIRRELDNINDNVMLLTPVGTSPNRTLGIQYSKLVG